MSILFKNSNILASEGGSYKEYKNAYLGVDGEYIDYIGDVAPTKKYDEQKDMQGKLLMPGLVNAHGHSAMVLVRAAGSGLPLDQWLNNAIIPIEDKMTPEDIYNGDLVAIMEMLASGTTQVTDMYDFPCAGALAYARSGIKANICRAGICFDSDLDPKDWVRTEEVLGFLSVFRDGKLSTEALRELPIADKSLSLTNDTVPEELQKAISSGRLKADMCLHSEYLTTERFVRAMVEANKEYKACVHVHISETKKEHDECIARHGKTPVAYFNDLGVFDMPTYAAHCVWCTDEDFDILKEKNVTIVHNPTSNLKLGSGIARIYKGEQMGINIALGTDGAASNNNLNMFEEMHLAALLQKGVMNDATVLSDEYVIKMGTENGSRALGRKDSGKLEVGMKADIIAIDTEGLHMIPNLDTKGLLCFSAQGSDVKMTMVDGKILYENGEYRTIDKEKILYEFKKSVERIHK